MKQKDIALIILIAVLAVVVSIVTSKMLFVTSDKRQQSVETVEAISTEFTAPSTAYFNENSINPTQVIQIGNGNNQAPFANSND